MTGTGIVIDRTRTFNAEAHEPYEMMEFKDASVQLFERLPKHWRTVKLKRLLAEPLMYGTNEAAELDDPDLPRYIRITDFDERGNLRTDTFRSLVFDKARGYYLSEGDVLFARSGATVGKSFLFSKYPGEACFAGYLIKARTDCHHLLPMYLYYYTKSPVYEAWKEQIFTQATIQNISATKYAYLPIILPPLKEQHKIVAYLDKGCAAIDGAIRAKRQQLEVLDNLRKSIIHKAVTRGLDEKVSLRYSGVQWIGTISEHWKIEKLKRLLAEPLMYGTNEAAELDDPDLPRYIRITDFEESGKLRADTFRSLTLDKAQGYYLSEGDMLFARSGATVGKSFIFKNYVGVACFAGYLIKARMDHRRLNPEFLYYYTKSPCYEAWKEQIFTQATIQNISATKYAYLPVVLPPLKEQRQIVGFLEEKLSELEQLGVNIFTQITTLEQYRKSVIHECVTGKRPIE